MGFKKFIVLLMITLFIIFVVSVLWLMDRGMPEPETLIKSVTWFLTGELTLSAALAIFRTRPKTLETGIPNEAIHFLGISVSPQRLFLLVVAIVVILALQLLYKRTKLGLASRAIAQNKDAAMAMGADAGVVSMFNFFLSGALAGIAGALLGAATAVTPAMGVHPLIKGLIVVIIGGLGSIGGAILAGFLLGVVDSLASLVMIGGVQQAIPFLVFLVVLCVRPQGFFGREFH